ncbi:MAG TPA: type 1 glutamine amidotransferase domain-containing protein [Chitinophagaceae bacterium]|nr:type 1 glutamine amidotransferase domain-containing protein [Chitinophagaceae bacterium]
MKTKKILFLATSHDKMGETPDSTGIWLEELAAAYYIFKEAGAEMIMASPKGGSIPLDPRSQSILVITRNGKRFLKDPEAMDFLANSSVLEKVNGADFDLVFLTGGHGAMWDLADNKIAKQLLEIFNNANKLIGSVGHGAVGLLSLQNDKGELLIKGRQLTAFSDTEEESSGLSKVVPFLLEDRLALGGALYSKGESYVSYVVADGNIVTGQNPASSEGVARKLTSLLL